MVGRRVGRFVEGVVGKAGATRSMTSGGLRFPMQDPHDPIRPSSS